MKIEGADKENLLLGETKSGGIYHTVELKINFGLITAEIIDEILHSSHMMIKQLIRLCWLRLIELRSLKRKDLNFLER